MLLIVLLVLSFFVSIVFSMFVEVEPFGNVALIPIKGELSIDSTSSFSSETTGSEEIVNYIEKAAGKTSIKAIVLDINSPGGSPVASREIADAIKRANKTTVAVIREVGASGAYWVASAADYIIADEMSITGSIGVISSYIEFAGLLQRYNMTYQRFTSGKYKDLGDPFKQLQSDEREILQNKMDKIHTIFIKSVAENRKMPEESVRNLATGEFYLGIEAKENGLIDAIGNRETAKDYLRQKLNLTEIEFAEYKRTASLLDLLSGVIAPQSFMVGKGIGSELKDSSKSMQIIT
jgi:protease-4